VPMTVSVVIPTYNVAICIERAIRSALDQSLEPIEVIVVDDGSTDSTCDIVSRLRRVDARIKLLRQPINRGPAAARNVGIKSALGDWIAILDADDAFLKERLRFLVEAAEFRNVMVAADNLILYDVSAQRIAGLAVEPKRIRSCLDLDRYSFVRNCMTNRPGSVDFGLLKPIIRRNFLVSTGVLYPEGWRHGEDFVFYLRAIMAGGKFSLFPEPLYLYSQRRGSISGKRSDLSRTAVDYRLMEKQTRELTLDPIIRADPMLCSLLLDRADRIKGLYIGHELRERLRGRNFVDLALHFFQDSDVRGYILASVRRKLLKLAFPRRVRS
jgi:succinoglycan biosynthesis protein ExoO